ncbi:MAG: hypothetical protein Q8M16_09840 [Pirellulaceae bacterium]|nr:hypothetical protein [Pirellulaceae bacterium]
MIATYNQISASNPISASPISAIANFEFLDLDVSESDFNSTESIGDCDVETRPFDKEGSSEVIAAETRSRAWHMKCECLNERHVFDLLDHVYRLHQEANEGLGTRARPINGRPNRLEFATPILIYVTDYQEAVEIDRCLSAVKLRTHLASPFSNWTNVLGKLGTGQLDVIISTTAEIPHADQIPWRAIYLPSALHLSMLTTPQMDWLGNLWFANHVQETPPRLIIRRTKAA